jgi:thymidylate synthase ThyX
MKVFLTQFGPTERATNAGRIVLSPEMSAAVAARHSRTSDGLESILSKIDRSAGDDAAIDSVFRFVDYGHRSIIDMVPASIHIEGASLFAVEFIWGLVHTGGGQETSTRFCSMAGTDNIYVPPEIPDDLRQRFLDQVSSSMRAYEEASKFWRMIADMCPKMVGVTDDMPPAKADRFKRNFVFDRSRYFIPVVCVTNMNITTWGTEWVRIVQALLSSPWSETREIGERIREELNLVAPRITKHAVLNDSWTQELESRISVSAVTKTMADKLRKSLETFRTLQGAPTLDSILRSLKMANRPSVHFRAMQMEDECLCIPDTLRNDMGARKNRYDPVGSRVSAVPVSYSFSGVATAEIRDMNRHRPGIRKISMRPEGFYFAEDQILEAIEASSKDSEVVRSAADLTRLGMQIGIDSLELASILLDRGIHSGAECVMYGTNLGNTFSFSHSSTFGHLVYECELRTGPGTHYRYRAHYKDLLAAIYEQYPLVKKFVLEGSGEPE